MKRLPKMTDEEAIASATLMGCLFHSDDEGTAYWVHAGVGDDNLHPIERERNRAYRGWRTKASLARAYLRYEINKDQDNGAQD